MSDGELFYAITAGVGRSHRSLFPVMLYRSSDQLSDDDLCAIIAHIRTLNSLPDVVPPTELRFPMNIIVRTISSPHQSHRAPDTSSEAAYGLYITTAAGCIS